MMAFVVCNGNYEYKTFPTKDQAEVYLGWLWSHWSEEERRCGNPYSIKETELYKVSVTSNRGIEYESSPGTHSEMEAILNTLYIYPGETKAIVPA